MGLANVIGMGHIKMQPVWLCNRSLPTDISNDKKQLVPSTDVSDVQMDAHGWPLCFQAKQRDAEKHETDGGVSLYGSGGSMSGSLDKPVGGTRIRKACIAAEKAKAKETCCATRSEILIACPCVSQVDV